MQLKKSVVYKNIYGSQPEDGFLKKVEKCRCSDFFIIFELYFHNKSCVRTVNSYRVI
jgi:hypothetical protein